MKTGKGAELGALIGGILGVLGGPAGIALSATAGQPLAPDLLMPMPVSAMKA